MHVLRDFVMFPVLFCHIPVLICFLFTSFSFCIPCLFLIFLCLERVFLNQRAAARCIQFVQCGVV